MATPIRIKRSTQSGKRPNLDHLQKGELAINIADGHLFAERDTGGVGIGTTVTLLTPWQEEYGGGTIGYGGTIKVDKIYVGTGNSIGISSVLDEDDLVSDSDTALATQQSIKKYVDAEVLTVSTGLANNTLEFEGDNTGIGTVVLTNQTFTISGTDNEVVTSGAGTTITVGLSSDVLISTSVGIGTTQSNSTLDVNGSLNVSGISTFQDKVIFDSTNSIQIPVGTDAEKDVVGTAVTGQIRYNTTNSQFEGFGPGNDWGSLGGVKDVDGDTYVKPESSPGSDEDALTFFTAGTQRAVIDSNGKVGIGTTNPTAKLDVNGTLNVTGVSTFKSNVDLGDDDRVRFGDGQDLQIFHNSSNNNSVIQETGNGSLIIAGNEVHIKNSSGNENSAKFIPNGAVELYYDNTKKFETTADGIKVKPNVGLGTTAGNPDATQDLAVFETTVGNASKLRIVETRDVDGTDWNSAYTRIQKTMGSTDMGYIQFNGDGNARGMEFGTDNNEKFAQFIRNKAVELYYNNTKKFETIADGIFVDSKVGIGTSTFTPDTDLHLSSTSPTIKLTDNSLSENNRSWVIKSHNPNSLRIQAINDSNVGGGHLFDFYRDDENVTQFRGVNSGALWFVVDNLNQKVGIGTTTPKAELNVVGVVSATSFYGDGTNLDLTDSVALGGDTTGNYVASISGTPNQVAVDVTSGESSTPQIGLPDDVIISQDLTVLRDLSVTGNITVGGTSGTLFTETLQVADADLILGIRTDANGDDISTDTTASHGGIAIASTDGSPLVTLVNPGAGETLPATYKKIMWFKKDSFAGLATDAWLINYGVGIGSTQVPDGVRLAAGGVHIYENNVKANTFESTIATGTAPLTVASTTLVTNLNADKLDGQDGSYYLDTSSTGQTKLGDLTLSKDGSPTFVVETSKNSNADALIKIRGARTASSTSDIAMLQFDNATGSAYTMAQISARDPAGAHADGKGKLVFRTATGGTLSDQVTIMDDGDVGIGTDSPTAKLDVAGVVVAPNYHGSMSDRFIAGLDAGGSTGVGATINSIVAIGSNAAKDFGDTSHSLSDGSLVVIGGNSLSNSDNTSRTGRYNNSVVVGYDNLKKAESSGNNVIVGDNIGAGLTSPTASTLMGSNIATIKVGSNHTWSQNIAIGFMAMTYVEGTTTNNIVLGNRSGSIRNGSNNILLGERAGQLHTNVNGSIGIGYSALNRITGGTGNIGIGSEAGGGSSSNLTGDGNIFIGRKSGYNVTTGNGNVVLVGGNSTQPVNVPLVEGDRQLVIGAASTAWIHGDSSYNIGIGTTNPTQKLHVSGVIVATGGSSTDWNTAHGWGDHSTQGYLTSGDLVQESQDLDDVVGLGSSTDQTITVGTASTGIVLNPNGNLTVTGDVTIGANIKYGSQSSIVIKDGNTDKFTFSKSNGDFTAIGNVTAYSDIKLKDSIKPIESAVDKVMKISGVTYTRNDLDDKNKRHAGVIAQEIEQVLPEVVNTDSNGIKSVAYGNLVALLIEAIKEQQEQINILRGGK